MAAIDVRIDKWKKRLLDLGKKNRLINYRETKRSNIKIVAPDLAELFRLLVVNETALEFPFPFEDFDDDEDEVSEPYTSTGDLQTNQTIKEQQKTLRNLRNKAKTALEEQGVNILYLSFGFLRWKENQDSDQIITSPIVLVPVSLTLESITSPFVLRLHEDEVVVNPTLKYKMEHEFGITLPEFDAHEDSITEYLNNLNKSVNKNKWEVAFETGLSLLSFLKINMYEDLDKNQDKIKAHPVLLGLAGDRSQIKTLPAEFNQYDHDRKTRAIDTFQVVDADSSQQDAILYSKKGVSFVLQGPPGTGKSQTITNIIAESLAEGKRVLFVSEKMAALEVVHKRLTQAGLSDFCLTLHSHRANKKEVLNDLGNTLALSRFKVHDEAVSQLELLEKQREKLNRYITELHTPIQPLNLTLYSVNGKLAKLYETPDVIFSIDNVGETTPEKLNRYIYLLNELSKTIGKMTEDYALNPWRNCIVPNVSHELRHDIETNLRKLAPPFHVLVENFNKVNNNFELNRDLTLAATEDILEIFDISEKSPGIPIHWITTEDITPLIQQAEKYLAMKKEYEDYQSELGKIYDNDYFNLQAENTKSLLLSRVTTVKPILNEDSFPSDNDILRFAKSIINELTSICGKIEAASAAAESIFETLKIPYKRSIMGLEALHTLLSFILLNPRPTEAWFDPGKYNAIKKLSEEAKNKYDQINNLTTSISSRFDKEIFDIDYSSMLKRFKIEYTTWFKVFKRSYRTDKKQIRVLMKDNSQKFDDQTIISVLNELKEIADIHSWLNENEKILTQLLGSHYLGKMTDWGLLDQSFKQFSSILNCFSGEPIPVNIKNFLVDGEANYQDIKTRHEKLGIIKDPDLVLTLQRILPSTSDYKNLDVSVLLEMVTGVMNSLQVLDGLFTEVTKHSHKELSYDEVIDDLSKLEIIQIIDRTINKESYNLKENFQSFFNGSIQTDWGSILGSLSWAGEFKKLHEKYLLPQNFIARICSDSSYVAEVSSYKKILKDSLNHIQKEWRWFANLFDNVEELQRTDLTSILLKISKCLNNISSLEEWIDFRSIRDECKKEGLSEYVQKVEELKIDKDLIVGTFLKRFYRLWVDSVILKFPAVNSFRSRSHDEIIREFNRLDITQLSLARTRIKERLVSRLPDLNMATMAMDEIGILKRELGKQRKILPLRKLFKAIPNLLLTLKPCLMMSPLSVSLFLDAENYNFDVVIFDEASQVCTEDAIGAIMRGKQVIIAGDNKQLPPTNFFAANTSDGDFDGDGADDEEFDDTDAFESILDESLTVLPERTLRWHYRSRHEHLIAFSNAKIYNHNLITFPSHIDKVPDHGVEYIYVENGVYDRGSKKCNVKEATRVAELVYEHFRNYPERSLGVVTFSEAQQQAVETAIRQLRLQNQEFEKFFNEDKEEAFFIKNLENVQGDERDTIIFSIGYAKDSNGIMYMNFGPLSRSGGYRRLNVAITRAKYNVKLVGSIRPTDIKLESTNAEGVKMLRSYIEFAMNGPDAILNELTYSDSVNVDSPFEESVYDFLVKNGFMVATQVGCSGYRIDLAVKHPTLSGRFVLGIECDGATYHSARTARERDRLRQTILEDIGWKIYRIWSTDWIKDPITEGRKLLDAVNKAISEYKESNVNSGSMHKFQSELLQQTIGIEIIENPTDLGEHTYDNPYSFDYYEEANVYEVKRYSDDTTYLKNVIKYVVEKEYPIHFELLCKRVARLLGNQKVTVKVRDSVNYVIIKYLTDKLMRKGDFLWIKGAENIKARVPLSNDVGVRSINHISKEEIAEAMLQIVSKSFGITTNDLYSVTARVFGFSRTGGNISNAMQQACDYLVESGVVKNSGGKIMLV
ncbi:DUF4011 domain-containing protein [Paenibacillus naphthalenovorans]|uniref:DUF4011 domain-containing protein n=1 Tax=Paenibacillus naphthalenovorans TaxID=162209 RepID=UPI00088F3EF5|nr:DUF3320 domain-containing protein [Paenibacillus naphthalenovorans]SDJ82459.1 Protein of unknown function [Paenibacillus naphthalenovorans]